MHVRRAIGAIGICAGLAACSTLLGIGDLPADSQQSPDAQAGDGSATPDSGGDGALPDGATSNEAGPFPAMPLLGTQIDRVGRPLVTTILVDSFTSSATTRGAARDAYNADADPTHWVAANSSTLQSSLAILDAFDQTCGNQALANGGTSAGAYTSMASILADDRLWLNTAGVTSTSYFSVEANATGLFVNSDCGGRKLTFDVVDESYSAFIAGGFSGVTDNVSAVASKTNGTTFPYLAAAQ